MWNIIVIVIYNNVIQFYKVALLIEWNRYQMKGEDKKEKWKYKVRVCKIKKKQLCKISLFSFSYCYFDWTHPFYLFHIFFLFPFCRVHFLELIKNKPREREKEMKERKNHCTLPVNIR